MFVSQVDVCVLRVEHSKKFLSSKAEVVMGKEKEINTPPLVLSLSLQEH